MLTDHIAPVSILAHRGWWTERSDRNSMSALERALSAGFGVETDVRDRAGDLVISHDPPGADAVLLSELLTLYCDRGWQGTLALNVKSDGIAEPLIRILSEYGIENYFTFDMSVPDTLGYLKIAGGNAYARWSEYEQGSILDEKVDGLWLDAFIEPHVVPATILRALDLGKVAAIVSPELHGKPHLSAWHAWKDVADRRASGQNIMICTDFPDDALAFFAPADGARS